MILSCLILGVSASGVSQRVAIPGLQGGAKWPVPDGSRPRFGRWVRAHPLNLEQFDLFAVLGDGFAERLRLAAAAFDDVLVEHGIVGHGIFSVVTGHAE